MKFMIRSTGYLLRGKIEGGAGRRLFLLPHRLFVLWLLFCEAKIPIIRGTNQRSGWISESDVSRKGERANEGTENEDCNGSSGMCLPGSLRREEEYCQCRDAGSGG